MSTQPKTCDLHARLAELQQKRQREEEERKQAEERLRQEAEVEAELVRQIAAEEERERQEAKAAERERAAEEVRRLEEEEHLRREAEHRAEAVRQVQAPASPMRVDNGSGDGSGDDEDAEEETEKKKGKGKETEKEKENEKNGWMIVGGSGRCLACRKDDTECRINLVEIEKWQKNTEKGRAYKKAPPTTSCQRCMEIRRKPCILPATEDGETGEADEAVGSSFCQFGREEAFGGCGSRASAQEETEEGGKEIVDGGGVLDGGCGYAGRD